MFQPTHSYNTTIIIPTIDTLSELKSTDDMYQIFYPNFLRWLNLLKVEINLAETHDIPGLSAEQLDKFLITVGQFDYDYDIEDYDIYMNNIASCIQAINQIIYEYSEKCHFYAPGELWKDHPLYVALFVYYQHAWHTHHQSNDTDWGTIVKEYKIYPAFTFDPIEFNN